MTKKWLIEISLAMAAIALMVLASFVCSWWNYEYVSENRDNGDYDKSGSSWGLTEQTYYSESEEDGRKSKEESTTEYSDSEFEKETENTVKTFRIVQYLAYGAIAVGIILLVFIALPATDTFKFKKETVISVALLAAFFCFVAPVFLMFQLPVAFEHDFTEEGADDSEDSPLNSFWGSNSEPDGDTTHDANWGGSLGWFLFVTAGVIQATATVAIALNKENYGTDKKLDIQNQAYPQTIGGPHGPQPYQQYPGGMAAPMGPPAGAMPNYQQIPPPPPGMVNGQMPPSPQPGMANGQMPPTPQQGMANGQMPPTPQPGMANEQMPPTPPAYSQPPSLIQQQVPSQPGPDTGSQIQCSSCGHMSQRPPQELNYKMACPRCGSPLEN